MIEFLIANIPILQNFKTLRPPHGLEEANVVHRPSPDQLRQIPHPSRPKLDQGQPPREGFGSISPKTREEIADKNYQFRFIVYRIIIDEYTDLCKKISNRLHATCGGGQTGLRRGIHIGFYLSFYTPQYKVSAVF